jgi:hypothetical protein
MCILSARVLTCFDVVVVVVVVVVAAVHLFVFVFVVVWVFLFPGFVVVVDVVLSS